MPAQPQPLYSKQPFIEGDIEGVLVRPLQKFNDARGWLTELYRHDELAEEFYPVMSYASTTHPGVARGPHEHVDQADLFFFFGPSEFCVYLWDNRPASPTYWRKMKFVVGENSPAAVLIPPGVVHAYQNVGATGGLVINGPNRLFKGPQRQEPIDEIRHEDDPNTVFQLT